MGRLGSMLCRFYRGYRTPLGAGLLAILLLQIPNAASGHSDPPGPPPVTTWAGLWDLTLTDAEFSKQNERVFSGLELVVGYTWSIGKPHVIRTESGSTVPFGATIIGQSTTPTGKDITIGTPLVFFMHDECWQIDAVAFGAKVVESDTVFFAEWLERIGAALSAAAIGLLVLPSPDPASKGSAAVAIVGRAIVGVISALLLVDGNDVIGDVPAAVLEYKEANRGGACPPDPMALSQYASVDSGNPSFGWLPILRDPTGAATHTGWLRSTGCFLCDGTNQVSSVCKGPAFGSVPFNCRAPTPTPVPLADPPDRRTSMIVEPLNEALGMIPSFAPEEGNPGGLSGERIQRLQEVATANTLGLADFLVALAVHQNLGLSGIEDAIERLDDARASARAGDVAEAMQHYESAILAAVTAHREGAIVEQIDDAFDVAVYPHAMTVPAGRRFPAIGFAYGVPEHQIVTRGSAMLDGSELDVTASPIEEGAIEVEVSVPQDAAPGEYVLTIEMERSCVGSCRGGGVTIADLITGVNIALGRADGNACGALDANGDGVVSIAELVQAVLASLAGCFVPPDEPRASQVAIYVSDTSPQPTLTAMVPTLTPTPSPTPRPMFLVDIRTSRGCGVDAFFLPGESADLNVTVGGSPTGLPVTVGVAARIQSELGDRTVPLFSYPSSIGQSTFRRVTFEESDADSFVTFLVEASAGGSIAQDECFTTVGSLEPTPVPTPEPVCGSGLVCDPEVVGMPCPLQCPLGPVVQGTCQSTGIGCRCFGLCL